MPRVEFGSDGIRGIVGEWPFLPSIVVKIGQALGQYVRGQSEHPVVVIGRDTRPSGEQLLHCLAAGLGDQGIDVINLGVMTTPGVAFITRRLGAVLGVIVSASHSPFQYNGIKLVKRDGLRLQREEEIEVEALIDDCVTRAVERARTPGQQTDGHHLIELYVQDHVKRCPGGSLEGLNVVLDCADGAASRVAPEAFGRLGAEVVAINDAMEGRSINYRSGSEYVRKQPAGLVDVMQRHGATYGFAFDGDGDRLVIVDSECRVYEGDDLLFILANFFHSRGLLRGNAVVTTQLANRGLEEALRGAGIDTVYTNKGDKNLEAAMWGGDFLLGGETGGNIIINAGPHTAADAVYAAVVLGGILVQSQGVGLQKMATPLRKRPQVIESRKLPATLTHEQKSALRGKIGHRQAELSGDSRILVWDSSTEPGIFRVMIEGSFENTPEEVLAMVDTIWQLVQQAVNPTD
jgi:phosphoglucosamine mutase